MIEIPARRWKALHLRRGQKARVVNTKGQQVVDTWAFNAADLSEFMSMEHSRVAMGRIIPVLGGNRVEARRPVSTPGSHVTLRAEMDCIIAFSACPQDMIPINGLAMRPTEAHVEILD